MSQSIDQDNGSASRVVLLATDRSQSILGEIVDGQTNTLSYSAYGEQSAPQKVETRLGFNGQLREASIGWYLLGNGYRAYNPRLMRFHSPDSWSPFGGGGLNAYMYCVGDPVNRVDPTGHIFAAAKLIIQENFSFGGSMAELNAKTVARRINGIARQKAMHAIGHNPNNTSPLFRPSGSISGALLGAGVNAASPPAYARGSPPSPNSPHVYPGGVAPNNSSLSYGLRYSPSASTNPYGNNASRRMNHSRGGRPTNSGHPPSYQQAMSKTGQPPNYQQAMSLSNPDTFAASQQGQTFDVYRVSINGGYPNFQPPPLDHPQLPNVPRPAWVRSPPPSPASSRDSTPPNSRRSSGDGPAWRRRSTDLTW